MSGTSESQAILIVAGTKEVNKKRKRHRKHGNTSFRCKEEKKVPQYERNAWLFSAHTWIQGPRP